MNTNNYNLVEIELHGFIKTIYKYLSFFIVCFKFFKMEDNDLEVLNCAETPEPTEQTSNTALELVITFTTIKSNF